MYAGNNHSKFSIKHANISDTDTKEEKQTLQSVLMQLNKSRGIYFLLPDQSVGNKLITPVNLAKGEIEKILDNLLMNTGLQYKKVNDQTFIVQQIKGNEKSIDNLKTNVFIIDNNNAVSKNENIAFTIVKGKVVASDGTALGGASVIIKGTTKGTSTNTNGEFSINAEPEDVLVVSFVGFDNQEIPVGYKTYLNITLATGKQVLNEVVVTTALGIQRKSKDLTYATQRLNNSDITTVKDPNFVNSLSGKVAGVTITKSASGLGGSARVILRGNKSTRENQPLYVVDGIPLSNYSPSQPSDVWGQSSGAGSGGRDGGDGISNINPDDIESITILKGASGAALYGSAAANGAIVITTKSGKAGRTKINFSSDITMENPLYMPQMQFKYGQTGIGTTGYDNTATGSWGNAVNAADNTKSFFQTGLTTTNSINLTGGTEKAQTYFSYANTHSKGIMPTSSLDKNNFNFRETAKFLHDKLVVDANILFLGQTANNRPTSGMYANPLTGLYVFPRGLDFNSFKNNYQYYSPLRNMNLQNWFDLNYDKGMSGQDFEQNPYWILNKMPRVDKRNRAITNLSLKYKINDWLSVQARGNFDKTFDTYDSRMNAGTQSVQSAPNGRYTYDRTVNTQMYGDFLLVANKQVTKDLNIVANLGSSINDSKYEDINFDTDPTATSGLYYANKFGVNYIMSDALISGQSYAHKQQQALFGSFQFGYKKFLFLDVTGRNDWSSTFAFTPTAKTGYFYYSAGANIILSEALQLPSAISFSKIRISYAKVGNDVPVYITNPPAYTIDNRFGAQFNTKVGYPGTYLQPEDNRSFEVGTEWRFIKDRVGIDFTYYKNNNYRQYMEVNAPLGSGYSKYYLNLGNIQNSGVEAVVFAV
ncbi:MAG: SusC/RagA family TonB-linked outer membrane protein, partial [Bacteroidota bacterium]|nr:SusC/RagA family TonB-linked outer membrane protein [Bacteroidota bacterium]